MAAARPLASGSRLAQRDSCNDNNPTRSLALAFGTGTHRIVSAAATNPGRPLDAPIAEMVEGRDHGDRRTAGFLSLPTTTSSPDRCVTSPAA